MLHCRGVTHLYQELIPPAIERFKALARVDVVDEDAAVCAAVECDAEGLEAFLPGGVPELRGGGGESEGVRIDIGVGVRERGQRTMHKLQTTQNSPA